MTVADPTSGISYTDTNFENIVGTASKALTAIVGEAKSSIGGFFAGIFGGSSEVFAGMDTDNIDRFLSAIDTYYQGVADIINDFNSAANTENAYKGEVGTAVTEFLEATKQILQRYVETIKKEKDELNHVAEQYKLGASTVSSSISDDASGIRSAAGNISLD